MIIGRCAMSQTTDEIVREYKLKKYYTNKKRKQCIVDEKKQCDKCNYSEICENAEVDNEV